MTTGGGKSEGGEAELRADSKTEVLQDGRLRTQTETSDQSDQRWRNGRSLSGEQGLYLTPRAHWEVLHWRDQSLGDQLTI